MFIYLVFPSSPHIICCFTQTGPLYVIVEYAPNGNLRDFLRKHRCDSVEGYEGVNGNYNVSQLANVTTKSLLTHKELISFAYQVSS